MDATFETWYASAATFARAAGSEIALRQETVAAAKWCASMLEMHRTTAERETALSCLRRISSILVAKPKLQVLLTSASGPAIVVALASTVVPLVELCLSQQTDHEERTTAAAVLVIVIETELVAAHRLEESAACTPVRSLPLYRICRAACDPTVNSVLRTHLVAALVTASQCVADTRSAVSALLADLAMEPLAIGALLRLRSLANPAVLGTIARRVDDERRRAASCATAAGMITAPGTALYLAPVCVEKWLPSGTSAPTFPPGGHAAILPTGATYSSPTALDRALWTGLLDELLARKSHSSYANCIESDVEGLVSLIKLTDVFSFPGLTLGDSKDVLCGPPVLSACPGERLERPDEWLTVTRALLDTTGGPGALFSVLLQFPTLRSLAALTGMAHECSSAALVHCVVPRMVSLLRGMPPNISGSAEDQEVVNWLCDSLRVHYSSSGDCSLGVVINGRGATVEGHPTTAAGKALFNAGLLALSHGYSDTERLPELLSRALRFHCVRDGQGCAEWLSQAITSDICCSTVAMRAVMDLIASFLGLESATTTYGVEVLEKSTGVAGSSAWRLGGEATGSLLTEHFEEAALLELACAPLGSAGVKIWRWLAEGHGRTVAAHGEALSRLLQSLVQSIERAVESLDNLPMDYMFDDIARLLVALLAVAPVGLAAPMFDVLVSLSYGTLSALPRTQSCIASGGSDFAFSDPGNQHQLTLRVIDEALAHVISLLPVPPALSARITVPLESELPVTPIALASALASSSDAVSLSLARILPLVCILSPCHTVRLRALEEVGKRSIEPAHIASDFGTACAILKAVPPASGLYTCDAPLQRAIEEAPSDVATAIAAATRTICMRSQRGFGTETAAVRVGLALPRAPASCALGNQPSQSSMVSRGARSNFVAPLDDCAVVHGALLRAGAPAAARAVCESLAGVLSGTDASVTHATPKTRRLLAAGALTSALARLLSWLALESENTTCGLGDGELAALQGLQDALHAAPRVALLDLASSSPRLFARLTETSQAWALAAADIRAEAEAAGQRAADSDQLARSPELASALDSPLESDRRLLSVVQTAQPELPDAPQTIAVEAVDPVFRSARQPVHAFPVASAAAAWQAYFRESFHPRHSTPLASVSVSDANEGGLELAPLLPSPNFQRAVSELGAMPLAATASEVELKDDERRLESLSTSTPVVGAAPRLLLKSAVPSGHDRLQTRGTHSRPAVVGPSSSTDASSLWDVQQLPLPPTHVPSSCTHDVLHAIPA